MKWRITTVRGMSATISMVPNVAARETSPSAQYCHTSTAKTSLRLLANIVECPPGTVRLGMPVSVFVDANGMVTSVHNGLLRLPQMEEALAEALASARASEGDSAATSSGG